MVLYHLKDKGLGKNTIDKNKNRIVWLILMLLVMTFIFVMSNQDGDTSGRIGNYVAKLLSIYSNNANIDASHTPLLFGLNLRKWAHVIVFALLGMTVVGLTKSVQKSIVICYIFPD